MRPQIVGWGFCALAVALAAAGSVAAQETGSGFELELGYEYSDVYLFRGVDLLEGEPTLTPRVIFGKSGFSAYYYGYYGDIGHGGPDLEEHDFGADYTFSRGRLELTLGAVAYTYRQPEDWEDTTEAYLAASLDVPLAPTLTVNREFESGGRYVSFGIGHEVPLWGDRLTLGLASTVGYDIEYWSEEFELDRKRGWSDLLLRADLTWTVAGPWAVYASVQHSSPLEVLDAAGQEEETFYAVGTLLGF